MMSDMQDPKKPKKGLSRLKLDIPLLGKKAKKRLDPAEKRAAEFLASQEGRINEAVNCGPGSGVGVVVDKDEAVLQVELLDPDNDEKGSDAPPAKLNLNELYKDCFEAKASYELALKAFIAHENKKRGSAADAVSHTSSETPAATPEPVVLTQITFEQLEDDIKQMEGGVNAAVGSLQDIQSERKAHHDKQWQAVQRLRNAFHKFAENASNVKSYVSLVPKSAGFGLGGLICAGINIVLKAAGRYVLMDKHVEHAIKRIKEALVHKAYTFDRHEPDERMHRLISGLFASIFRVLESVLEWTYQKETGMALLKALLKPETYGQDLAMLIADMERRSGAVEKYGRDLELSEIRKMQDTLMGTAAKTQGAVKKVLRGQSHQLKALERLCGDEEDIKARVTGVGKAVEQAGAATATGIEDLTRRVEHLIRLSKANVVQTVFVLISQDPPQGQVVNRRLVTTSQTGAARPAPRPAPRPAHRTRKQAPAAEPELDTAAVLAVLGFDPELVPGDGRNILREARAQLSTQDGRLVAEMTNHVRLQALIEAPSSAALFVEGGSGGRHDARGPISVATAQIVTALARGRKTNPSLYALAYFCSEHRNARQRLGSAAELIITLLLQLLDQHRSFDSRLLSECRDAVRDLPLRPSENDVQAFCDLLRRCVLALPGEATLFCVIEGIAFFEGPKERTAHMKTILSSLLELGDEGDESQGGHARVKCLFTTPARSPGFTRLFQPYEVLTMQVVNSSGFFRRHSWIMGRAGNSEEGR